ncbi:MAG: HPr family phosphocarrier protein [Candidatus Lambdaproteobacteria bacterium]|nr:HPr family phosphocarrier protein [Candidatus Lambdaproteobacteria bacterium]
MKSAQITIQNRLGLHARAAAKLVQTANQFSSALRLGKDAEEADAKSIMEVLMLAGTKGTALTVTGEGSDEEIAVDEILRLINDKFGEGE